MPPTPTRRPPTHRMRAMGSGLLRAPASVVVEAAGLAPLQPRLPWRFVLSLDTVYGSSFPSLTWHHGGCHFVKCTHLCCPQIERQTNTSRTCCARGSEPCCSMLFQRCLTVRPLQPMLLPSRNNTVQRHGKRILHRLQGKIESPRLVRFLSAPPPN
jgi:hypothetical protein